MGENCYRCLLHTHLGQILAHYTWFGPLLFLMYCTHLEMDTCSSHLMFALDVCTYLLFFGTHQLQARCGEDAYEVMRSIWVVVVTHHLGQGRERQSIEPCRVMMTTTMQCGDGLVFLNEEKKKKKQKHTVNTKPSSECEWVPVWRKIQTLPRKRRPQCIVGQWRRIGR